MICNNNYINNNKVNEKRGVLKFCVFFCCFYWILSIKYANYDIYIKHLQSFEIVLVAAMFQGQLYYTCAI